MICPMCNKRQALYEVTGMMFCKECADILNNDIKSFNKWRNSPHWIDFSDYCPTAYGFGDNPTEPIWRFECSECGERVFDEFPPDKCPNCHSVMRKRKAR